MARYIVPLGLASWRAGGSRSGRTLSNDQSADQRPMELGMPTAVNCGEPVAGYGPPAAHA